MADDLTPEQRIRERKVEIHIKLSALDRRILTSPDGRRIEVDIGAVRKLVYGE